MLQHIDPFDIVKRWWGNKPIPADISKMGINLNSKQGAFECFILAVLYSIEDPGKLAGQTFKALRKQGLTNINLLSSTAEDSPEWSKIVTTFEQYYHGRQKNLKTKYITEGARSIVQDSQLKGDLRNLHLACRGNEYEMLDRLWKFKGLKKKAFWIMREMRRQGVWRISGKYCCVPDKQVGSSLERWNKISGWEQNQGKLRFLLNCSDIVWQAFGVLYDFPILDYSRIFNCNDDRSRKCQQCDVAACNARSTHVTFVGNEAKDKEGEMNKDNKKEELTLWLPAEKMNRLKEVAEEEFGTEASTLAQVWIIERLKQLCVGYQSSSVDVPVRGSLPLGSLPKKYADIKVNQAMVKYQAIPFYKSQQIPFALPSTHTLVTLVYAGRDDTRTYDPRWPGFKFAPIFRSGISVGSTIRVTELVPFKKYEVS